MSRGRKACAAGTRTTPGCSKCSAGSRRFRSKMDSPGLTPGSKGGCVPHWRLAIVTCSTQMPSDPDPAAAIERFDVLGLPVSAITMAQALTTIERWIEQGIPRYVCITGVHGVMESRRDDDLRQIHAGAGMVTPDGMPLVWLAH